MRLPYHSLRMAWQHLNLERSEAQALCNGALSTFDMNGRVTDRYSERLFGPPPQSQSAARAVESAFAVAAKHLSVAVGRGAELTKSR